ncbi:MAG TPA: M36 family metallopeptidase, partial [Myxococcota bacterium]|nr:M36 family metallopeptidase [Myxococcota bacterium]
MRPSLHRLLSPLAPLVAVTGLSLAACGDDDKPATTADTSDTTDNDVGDTTEAGDTDDTGAPDTTEARPLAKVHRIDPLSTPNLNEVELEHLTSDDGRLVGDYARVRSCLPDLERGVKVPLNIGLPVNLTACFPDSQVRPGDDGTYLHVAPPATPAADDGQYAEVMMYHHMQVVHDYFKDIHGLTDRDHPLDAITNVQAHVDLCDQWAKIANAAFFPEGAFEGLGLPIGADAFDIQGDAIVFSGTDTKNFAFDASVIYHEYVHAILGATRLNAAFLDAQGLNNLPGALNEAYADYFAGTLTGESLTGNYALNDIGSFAICGFELGGGGNLARDMQVTKTCPFDLTAEVHADAEIFSSALWQIRADLGPTDADAAILAAVLTLTNTSDFDVAAAATIEAVTELYGDAAGDEALAAFTDRGLIGCERVIPIERLGARGLPLTLEAKNALSPNPFAGFMPSYLQLSLVVPENTAALELTLEVSAGGGFGGFGGGGESPILEVAMKQGEDPVSYTFGVTAGSGRHDADLVLPVVDGKVTLAGEPGQIVTPGSWTLAIH